TSPTTIAVLDQLSRSQAEVRILNIDGSTPPEQAPPILVNGRASGLVSSPNQTPYAVLPGGITDISGDGSQAFPNPQIPTGRLRHITYTGSCRSAPERVARRPRRWSARRVLDSARDLVLGSTCVGCGRPGRLLCDGCAAALDPAPFPAWPSPVPPGLRHPWTATTYDGTVRAMVLGHKEQRLLALARPLGDLLACAVGAAVADLAPEPAALLLVPVPSRPATLRQRGHDPTGS